MRCDEVAALLPGLVDGDRRRRISRSSATCETCLRCQAELARYRKLVRTSQLLRTRYVEPTPGLLGETLAALTDAAERRRAPHAAVAAAGSRTPARSAAPRSRPRATAAAPIARSRRRSQLRLAG